MAVGDQSERVVWHGGVPVSLLYDDPYYSLAGGLEEARHVFLTGNRLMQRMTDGFRIAELGFGTGLNLIAVVLAWAACCRPGHLHFTSFEAHPMPVGDMALAHGLFPEADPVAPGLQRHWAAEDRQFDLGGVRVNVITGDARRTLPDWQGMADAWFLDGFSPAKNPALWGEDVLNEVARHTAAWGTFATYSAAGSVRRGLQAAGFQVERVAGYGTKRHMSCGSLAEPR